MGRSPPRPAGSGSGPRFPRVPRARVPPAIHSGHTYLAEYAMVLQDVIAQIQLLKEELPRNEIHALSVATERAHRRAHHILGTTNAQNLRQVTLQLRQWHQIVSQMRAQHAHAVELLDRQIKQMLL